MRVETPWIALSAILAAETFFMSVDLMRARAHHNAVEQACGGPTAVETPARPTGSGTVLFRSHDLRRPAGSGVVAPGTE
jgi:hypothetical protein